MLPTRRVFLSRALGASCALAGAGALFAGRSFASPSTGESTDISQALFDRIDQLRNGNTPPKPHNEDGQLGWGEAYTLSAYVLMFEATKNTQYLDRFISRFDHVLQSRDSIRGVKDYRGPVAARVARAGTYTAGAVTLLDAQGQSVLEIRTGARPAGKNTLQVLAGHKPGTFTLVARGGKGKAQKNAVREDVYQDLSLDRASDNYAVTRIARLFREKNAGPGGASLMITARDLREPGTPAGGAIKPGEPQPFAALPYIYAVQTGMIATPAARFVALVQQRPELAGYRAKADEYLSAIEQAADVHDFEWRENSHGEGWLVWPKGSPNVYDGSDQPHNQYLSLGRLYCQLAALSRDAAKREKYLDRAMKMARTFKNDLKKLPNDTYSWTYFWSKGRGYNGWTERDGISENQPDFVLPATGGYRAVEDTSHAHIDIDFALMIHQQNPKGMFGREEMERFARTFTKNIVAPGKNVAPAMRDSVDGSGEAGPADNIAATWVGLATFDPQVYEAANDNYESRDLPATAPSVILGIAYLNWFASAAHAG